MSVRVPETCRCCDRAPRIGHFGLCSDCQAAVGRFLAQRRANLKARGLA